MFTIVNRFIDDKFNMGFEPVYNLSRPELNDFYFVVQNQDDLSVETVHHRDIDKHFGRRAIVYGPRVLCEMILGMYNTTKFLIYDEFPAPGDFTTDLKGILHYAELKDGTLDIKYSHQADMAIRRVYTSMENELAENLKRLCVADNVSVLFDFDCDKELDNYQEVNIGWMSSVVSFGENLWGNVSKYLSDSNPNITQNDLTACRTLCKYIEEYNSINFKQFFRKPRNEDNTISDEDVSKTDYFKF